MKISLVSDVFYDGCNSEFSDMGNPRGEMYSRKWFFHTNDINMGLIPHISIECFNSEYEAELFLESGLDINWETCYNSPYSGDYDRDAELCDWIALDIY